MSTRRRGRRLAVLGALAAGLALGTASGTAYAADATGSATIDHSEVSGDRTRLLVTVPGTDEVDLGSVAVTLDGAAAPAEATRAEASNDVRRSTVLAIDTSGSMAGDRIAAAKAAALSYLDAVPANVLVGIVTFNNQVQVRQEPSLDRDASKALIEDLAPKGNTSLYQGVSAAITATGSDEGQRQVLVLSDGEDTTKATLAPVVAAIKKNDIKLDVVSLEQGAAATADLSEMADAGHGDVLDADAASLESTFADEADALARQILVTVTVPETQKAKEATVAVSVDAGSKTYDASAFVAVRADDTLVPAAAVTQKPVAAVGGSGLPAVAMYAALVAIGVGVLGLGAAFAMGGVTKKPASLQDQFAVYSASAETSARTRAQIRAAQDQSASLAEQARQFVEKALANNSGLDSRVAARLEGAGMALKSSEWLLLHASITFIAAMVGLLLGGGNPIAFVLLGAFGAVGPWLYLGMKRSKRLKAFDSGLADTLQLMSGSLSAGLSLAQSLDTIVREGSEPITSEFKRVIVESRLGVPLEDALDGVASRMQSEDFKWVVMAIRIQREVGGNLAELLLNVAKTLREREYIRRHVRALSAEGRLSCWILGGLPPAFLAYLSLTKGDYVHPMYTTPLGWLMCGGMALLLAVGIVWMSKVAKVEV